MPFLSFSGTERETYAWDEGPEVPAKAMSGSASQTGGLYASDSFFPVTVVQQGLIYPCSIQPALPAFNQQTSRGSFAFPVTGESYDCQPEDFAQQLEQC